MKNKDYSFFNQVVLVITLIIFVLASMECGGKQKKEAELAKKKLMEEIKMRKEGGHPPPPKLKDPYAGMVMIPGGEFRMGTNRITGEIGKYEKPEHTVFVPDFYIDKYEVTVSMFKKWDPKYQPSRYSSGDEMPATRISYEEADSFCKWLGRRLPTEEEWEKAARGRGNKLFGYTDDPDSIAMFAHIGSLLENGAMPVGSFPPNDYGVYDMIGNAFEWTSSILKRYPGNNELDKEKYYMMNYRVFRGGSWTVDEIASRATRRWFLYDLAMESEMGFRCAKDAPKK